jgi:hypothetical protein
MLSVWSIRYSLSAGVYGAGAGAAGLLSGQILIDPVQLLLHVL